ncbi:MAG: VOC family protein [Silicimonas sp.]|jgi:predicted enzyme related to lactoylglutathione lyase|nr:VOC family protein [Silicimonas sp.]
MEKVKGVGGVFFRATNPAAMTAWYRDVLGVDPAPTDMETPPWIAEGGVTVFAPFSADTDYFPSEQQVMVNFRVDDLDAMLAQVRAAGVEPFNETTLEGIGRFAHIHDPEGNAVELWEPAAG